MSSLQGTGARADASSLAADLIGMQGADVDQTGDPVTAQQRLTVRRFHVAQEQVLGHLQRTIMHSYSHS